MDLVERVTALESAVIALGHTEFGDKHGHKFHGNQWKDEDAELELVDHEKSLRRATKLFKGFFDPGD